MRESVEMMDVLTDEDFSSVPEDVKSGKADANNNNSSSNSDSDARRGSLREEKYSLRPRSLRQKTEKGLELKKEIMSQRNRKNQESGKPKAKPPPLSKYRRKTANARERNRMREINVAFETLRRVVPQISGSLNSGNEKLTKITTLRLAMKYIQALRQVLDGTPAVGSDPKPTTATTVASSGGSITLAATFIEDDDDAVAAAADLDVLLSDGESLNFNSDMSESFASPDHPLTSPFSELSTSEPSPDFCGSQDFPFGDSVMASDFCLTGDLSDSEFCREFLNGHCFEGLS